MKFSEYIIPGFLHCLGLSALVFLFIIDEKRGSIVGLSFGVIMPIIASYLVIVTVKINKMKEEIKKLQKLLPPEKEDVSEEE